MTEKTKDLLAILNQVANMKNASDELKLSAKIFEDVVTSSPCIVKDEPEKSNGVKWGEISQEEFDKLNDCDHITLKGVHLFDVLEEVCGNIYDSIDLGLKRQIHTAKGGFTRFMVWYKYTPFFNCWHFSNMVKSYILTKYLAKEYTLDGESVVVINLDENIKLLKEYIHKYADNYVRRNAK